MLCRGCAEIERNVRGRSQIVLTPSCSSELPCADRFALKGNSSDRWCRKPVT
jgi:hypothetical protein